MVVILPVLVDCSVDGSTSTQTGLALCLGDAPVPRYSSFDQPPQHSLGFSFQLKWNCCVDLLCRELASKGHNLNPTPEAMGAVSSEGQVVRQHANLELRLKLECSLLKPSASKRVAACETLQNSLFEPLVPSDSEASASLVPFSSPTASIMRTSDFWLLRNSSKSVARL